MNKNIRKKNKRIKIRPLDIILAVLIILAVCFFSTMAAGADRQDKEMGGSKEAETIEQQAAATPPIAGVTKSISDTLQEVQAEEADTAPAEVEQVEEAIEPEPVEEVQEPEEKAEEITHFTEAIPLSEEYQEYFYIHAKEFGCPLDLAYGTADVETGFSFGVIGAAGEVGIMQILPGGGNRYFIEIQRQCGYDPTTKEGNIACGCYLLGKYYMDYGGIECAAMAYNMGVGGAQKAWARGVYSSEYSRKVTKATEQWREVLEDAGIE